MQYPWVTFYAQPKLCIKCFRSNAGSEHQLQSFALSFRKAQSTRLSAAGFKASPVFNQGLSESCSFFVFLRKPVWAAWLIA